ncbi:NAD-dependent epimerase/dehydratase family protein [Rhodobacterales bacterium LSUCC0031]|nr:NAD-dependent epimerase/dehydratase family protein [Rhodobacterales bacterium LSUCC0031]
MPTPTTKRSHTLPAIITRGPDEVIIVTGGAGFLGSHLCARLIAGGARVIAIDNLSTGKRANVAHLAGTGRFDLIAHDIVMPITIREPVSAIYNLACPASPPKYQMNPVHTFRTSIDGAQNMLELAKHKSARILQASTSEVYGDPEMSPQPESYCGAVNTYGPRACYDEGKRGAETLFYEYARAYGLETRIARIFNTYGPRMDALDGRVVSNFVVQALAGQDITIYGTGEQTRSFCYVDDLIDGLIRLMNNDDGVAAPVNLGNPREFTVLELAKMVLAKTGSASQLRYLAALQDDPKQRRPDITLAHTLLGWQPTVSLNEGLDRMIAHFGQELGQQSARVVS